VLQYFRAQDDVKALGHERNVGDVCEDLYCTSGILLNIYADVFPPELTDQGPQWLLAAADISNHSAWTHSLSNCRVQKAGEVLEHEIITAQDAGPVSAAADQWEQCQ